MKNSICASIITVCLLLTPSASQALNATWTSPNASYISVADATQWGGTLPNQVGDFGNATGAGPIRINMNHSSAWNGTLNVNPSSGAANLDFSNGGIGNGNSVKQLNLTNAAILGTSTQNNGRSLGAAGDVLNFAGNTTLSLENSNYTPSTAWNVWGNIQGSGTLSIISKRTNNSSTIATILRGTVTGVDILLSQAYVNISGQTTFSFTDSGDNINTISASSTGLQNRLLLSGGSFNFDLSGFDWDQTVERSWNIIDWSTNLSVASGWSGNNSSIVSGSNAWTKASGSASFYNGANGYVWTYSDSGLDWTFTESTGVLAVVPEPSSAALLVAAGVSGILLGRRRR